MRRVSFPTFTAALLAAVLAAGTAEADHYRGVRATVTSQNPTTFDVTFDLTVFTDGPAIAGDSIGAGSFSNGTVAGQHFPAIQWGDGVSTVISTSVLFVNNSGPSGTATYRGSFSHTYPDATPRTIRVAAGCCAGTVGNSGDTPVTGNPVIATYDPAYMVGFTNTVQAFAAAPALPEAGLGLLAVALGLAGSVLLWRRRSMMVRG